MPDFHTTVTVRINTTVTVDDPSDDQYQLEEQAMQRALEEVESVVARNFPDYQVDGVDVDFHTAP